MRAAGEREVLGLDLGPAEDRAFWLSFVRSLVVGDAHEGLKRALGAMLGEAAWQRCRVHFMCNVLSQVPKAAADVLTYMAFPSEHRRQLHSTNTLERLNFEIKRRTDVVGIFPNRTAEIRLFGAVLAQQNDEWATGRRYFSQEYMGKLHDAQSEPVISGLLAAD